MSHLITRRDMLRSAAVAAGVWTTYGSLSWGQSNSPNEKLNIAAIGVGGRGGDDVNGVAHENIVALCDVDEARAGGTFNAFPKAKKYRDFRQMLDEIHAQIDAVVIGTPDHWHAKMVIDACRAGKDVYCEKPLTLTIDEGKILSRVVAETGRVVQVGSWQRSDHRFRTAVEYVRAGRIGELRSVEVVLGKNEQGGPFERTAPPKNLNWNLWQGQTPDVPFIAERSHYTFRWWMQYSGGQMTDWGAHHIDIAHWAINSQPVKIEGTATWPDMTDGYNVAKDFSAKYTYANGVELTVLDHGRNGILFTGTEGRIFVNRESLAGKPVEHLAGKPESREAFRLYDFDNLTRPTRVGKLDAIVNHVGNFFDCVVEKRKPLSDIEGQHRSVSVSHLGNIAMRVGRPLTWDPEQQVFPGDDQANSFLKREQRAGFEVA